MCSSHLLSFPEGRRIAAQPLGNNSPHACGVGARPNLYSRQRAQNRYIKPDRITIPMEKQTKESTRNAHLDVSTDEVILLHLNFQD